MKPSKQDETPPAGDSEEPRALTPHAPTIESGEWVRKGATLSDATALKEYGVNREFIVKGIRAGKLDYREGAIWGNPYLRLLRSQLELYIVGQHGAGYLAGSKTKTELRKINKEIAEFKRKLTALQVRKAEIEKAAGR